MDDKLLELVGLIPGVLLAFAIRQRIRRYRPNVRLITGLVGLAFALVGLLVVFRLLPSLRPADYSIALYTLEFFFIGFVGGLLLFSLLEIAGGGIRIPNRRRPLHRD
ncbi:MAG: hypothetical protein U0995_06405 [Erythrobacter sp.]|nr:hypothetical protein [Erythrobacter sp.]MDZ4272894.1 hypothetical protein [Erythrobacter sp.]MDZ4275650.1 hypothetical protein [Erythrobacter sp.]